MDTSNMPRFGIERCQIARLWPYKELGLLIIRLRRLLSPTPTPTATTTPTATATATFTATETAHGTLTSLFLPRHNYEFLRRNLRNSRSLTGLLMRITATESVSSCVRMRC